MSIDQSAPADMLAADVTLPEQVVHRTFPSEMVVLNLETGKYHGLNPIAGRMLEVMVAQDTVKAAAAVIAEEYGQPVEQVESDICDLCLQLVERGLISLQLGTPG